MSTRIRRPAVGRWAQISPNAWALELDGRRVAEVRKADLYRWRAGGRSGAAMTRYGAQRAARTALTKEANP
jgi:hypothetical protein